MKFAIFLARVRSQTQEEKNAGLVNETNKKRSGDAHFAVPRPDSLMPFSPLRSMPATLAAFMMMCATPASSSTGPDLSPYPCTDDDPDRGGGLPHCECDAYHNGAFQCMSRMCSKPWEDMNVCYPTRVGHPGTVLEGRYFNNYCDDGQDMCSPWTPPASSFPVYVADRGDEVDSAFALAARGCAVPAGPQDQDLDDEEPEWLFIKDAPLATVFPSAVLNCLIFIAPATSLMAMAHPMTISATMSATRML